MAALLADEMGSGRAPGRTSEPGEPATVVQEASGDICLWSVSLGLPDSMCEVRPVGGQ